MRILIVFSLLFFGLTGIAQDLDTLNQTNAEGKKTGYWIVRHPNGNIRYEGRFVQDKPVGAIRRYDTEGVLQSVSHYSPTSDTLRVEMFYTNGYRAATGTYLHREKEGKWQYYSFYTRDYIVLEEAYRNGLRNGVCRKFHTNGQIAEILHWKAGVKHGKWQQYSLEGILLLEANYQQGKLHGAYLVNHHNGQIHVKGQYQEDLREGDWIFKDETGQTTQNLHFQHGIADNQAGLDRQHQQLLDQLDSMKGKIKDPTLDEIRW